MKPLKKLYVLFSLLLLSLLAASCSGDKGKANKLIDEGNAAVKEALNIDSDSEAKLTELNNALDDFPQNRDQLKPTAQAMLDNLDKSIAKLREAASKYDEGSKLNLEATLKEYLSLRSQAYSKGAERQEAMKAFPKAVMDTSIEDADALKEKLAQITEQVNKADKEAKDLEARAQKIEQENKDKFKS
jgi:chromosome segregation ATPase